jgi:hypothetical protein
MLDDSVAHAVDMLNEGVRGAAMPVAPHEVPLADPSGTPSCSPDEPLVTFSHFLPRIELLPEKRFLFLPPLAKASGSAYLNARVQALRPSMHVFGHTHFGWDQTFADDGVRYVQAALGYPSERLSRWHTLRVGGFGADGPLLLWSAQRGFAPHMHCRWSGFYEYHPRKPERVFELASYTAHQFRKTDKRAVVVTPDFSHEAAGGEAGPRMLAADPILVKPSG